MDRQQSHRGWFAQAICKMEELTLAKETVVVCYSNPKNRNLSSEFQSFFNWIKIELQDPWPGWTQPPKRWNWSALFHLELVRRRILPLISRGLITSFLFSTRSGCAQAGYPGVYAEVSTVLSWVNQFVVNCGDSTDDPGTGTPAPTDAPSGCARYGHYHIFEIVKNLLP